MGNFNIPNWLEGMPLAPEFRPTDTEFADPIAYISKIEKEVGPFGICKVIPPLPRPSKKYVFSNLNKSLSKCPELGSRRNAPSECNSTSESNGGNDGEIRAVFTTRQQELGQNAKKPKVGAVQNPPSVVHKQVWQSGEIYTLEQFEAKSKVFAKSQLGTVKEASPLVVEAMFWKAASEKPIYLEYANDVPGSGFGEPDGQHYHFHRRRRKRNFFTRVGECKTNDIVSDRIEVPRSDSGTATSCTNAPKSPTSQSTFPANEKESTSVLSKKKSQSSCYDKEGSLSWKISNSPWNLQVISRSAGSLTRFMPDDIPGVTSPMVYIGMLFSWFAWHVEDHELHSMNFLHTGSSKTWYSVPGDYAFAFEELVRSEAYGGKFDRIAALALLGEKTTLMSPEVVIASGIPCCRLVQNPGEFVVTFPRAYHVGFSHGFNCGEAANFGTPQWLKVAKEAAVRRAAMNYLPMLSHQQLLYLLTMSFVSRVPRSLLPGVRSSRLRDRQKEERELLVKKAFIEDILKQNSVLSVLLSKDSGYRAVLWNPDLLNYPSKESLSHMDSKKPDDEQKYFGDDMSLYMENLDDFYLGIDDLSCDFQVDSGTLACVACGILGFPFMSVVQPSEKASLEFIHHDRHGVSGYTKKNLDPSNNCSSKEKLISGGFEADLKSNDRWNAHNKFLRPRSFCLEHAVEIADLLQGKGGANVLVICHSDYQKIKAHATTISEDIGSPFNYKEVPLDKASRADLSLIDLAIDNGECHGNSEDWTSKSGINLRHCVKIRKNSPSKQVQHALTLGGLFSDKPQISDYSAINWKSRKSRSKKLSYSTDLKARDITESKNKVMPESSCSMKKQVKLIQYTRRNHKRKGKECESHATLKDCDRIATEPEKVENFSSLGFSPSDRMSAVQSENETSEFKTDENRLAASNTDEGTEKSFEVPASEMHSNIEADEEFLVGLHANSSHELFHERVSITEMKNDCPNGQVCHPFTGNDEDTERQVLCTMASTDEFSEGPECYSNETNLAVNSEQIRTEEFSNGETMEIPKETRSIEDHSNSTCLSTETRQGTEPSTTITMEEYSQVPTSTNCDSSSLDIEMQQKAGSLPEELALSSSTQIDCIIVPREKLPEEDTGNDVTRKSGSVSIDIANIGKQPNHERDSEVLDGEFNSNTNSATKFQKYSRVKRDTGASDNSSNGTTVCDVITADSSAKKSGKRKREDKLLTENNFMSSGYTRSPCEGLRPRATASCGTDAHPKVKEKHLTKKRRKPTTAASEDDEKKENSVKPHKCDIEGCSMSFDKKAELSQHKRNRCPYEGCGKRFSSHKYAMIHDRVHSDQRPLKCPWKGCSMSFKWSWARTEHIRVHTGERPYSCAIDGCGLSFRFVSDFSRHRRKTGHHIS